MKLWNGYRMKMVLAGVVGIIVLGGRSAKADFTFGEPTNLGPVVNNKSSQLMPSISADGLELYFMSNQPGGYFSWDMRVTKRASLSDPWEEPANLGPLVNDSVRNWAPCISAEGLELYYQANRAGGFGGQDIWVTVRETRNEPWGEPINLGPTVNSWGNEADPSISADGLELYFRSGRSGGYGAGDLWVSKRPSRDEPWGSPINLGATINTPDGDNGPNISADGLVLFFASGRFNEDGGLDDLWLARRKTKDDAWDEPVDLGPSVNTIYSDLAPSISADGRTLYFSDYSDGIRPGGHGGADLYKVSVTPIVDLNGDSFVDSTDMCIVVDHWGTDEPLCDIGPTPWGDGIVDVQDLIVLAEHLFEEFPPSELVE